MNRIEDLRGRRTLVCAADGPQVATERDATDIIGEAFSAGDVTLVVLPVERLAGGFFQLRTGMAGAITQKFVNYGFQLAIVGDISAHVAASKPLRDYVHESNRGRQVWFAGGVEDLEQRLA